MRKGKKVLVVEDEPDQLTIRCMLLAKQGLTSLSADGPESALELATTERPSCAVMDLRMPTVQSGLRLIRELKKLDPAIKIVLLTGGAVPPAPEIALVEVILDKSSPTRALMQTIRSLCA